MRLINSDTSGVYNSDIPLSHRQNNPGYCRVNPGRASVLMGPKKNNPGLLTRRSNLGIEQG